MAVDDIDGELRAAFSPRDIGADEFSPPGGISGVARDGSAAPAPGVAVIAYGLPTRAVAGQTTTSGSGAYEINGLAPGAYAMQFADAANAKRYLPEWYDDRITERSGSPVQVASGATTPGIDATLDAAPLCRGLAPTIVGTRGNDFLYGTSGPDVISGADGNDEIAGNAGDDVICGGRGNDILWGGRGDDYLHGGAGSDVLRGEGGRDTLRDGAGSDSHYGGPDDDNLRDMKGRKNTIAGGSGTDTCKARAGDSVTTCELP